MDDGHKSLCHDKGLRIELPIIEASGNALGLLDCQFHDEIFTCLAIALKRTHTSDVFFRTSIEEDGRLERKTQGRGGLTVVIHEQALKATVRQIYIPRDEYEVPSERSSYQIKFPVLQEQGFQLVATRPDREMLNVTWNNQAQSLHIVHKPGTSWRSIAFVFHHLLREAAFAVYMDEYALVDTDKSLSWERETASNIWFSLVPRPKSNDLPRASYGLEDWWYSLSYGIDQHGVADYRGSAMFVKWFTNQITPSQISATLEAANRFGQTVRVLHIDFREDTDTMEDEKGDSSSGNWESTSRSNWMKDLLSRSSKRHISPSRSISQASIAAQASASRTSIVPFPWDRLEEEYSTKEVVPQDTYWKHNLSLPTKPQPQLQPQTRGHEADRPSLLPWRFSKRGK
ncbi:hypothetical protein N431DRAFT_467150 [Stipitochalara longipes BDJ]|nr:hypothetical protein N431DRAFT_467150 [Stipitochalara longipes BDJ]